jgi:polyhydroxyalkanoate synthesis regulator phasin
MNNLEKFFYVSLGLASEITKRLENNLKKLTEQGKISEIDAKKIISDFKESTERYSNEVSKKFNEFIQHSLDSLKLAKQKDLDEIRQRIQKLEEKIKQL